MILEEHSYIPRFESANTSIDFIDDEPDGEDSDNDITIDTRSNKAVPKSAASKRKGSSRTTNDNEEVGDRRKLAHGKGKRKIEIEYVKDKKSRAVTFTKRKAGIFTKARELSTLTGSSILLLVVSESGVVYTYTTEKFQPMVTQDAGKNMIAACLSGKVNLDERFNSTSFREGTSSTGPKKGGDILLKDAFSTALPPPSSTLPMYNDNAEAGPSGYSRSNGGTADYAAASTSNRIYSDLELPPLPAPNPQDQLQGAEQRHANEVELVKVPRLRSKRPRETQAEDDTFPPSTYDYHHGQEDSAAKTIEEQEEGEDDLSEGECEAQMRKLRRSLSIERRFEKVAEEERPRLLRHDDNGGIEQEEWKPTKEELEREKERMREMSKRWSFTAAADAWENFPRPFGRSATDARQSDLHPDHGRATNGNHATGHSQHSNEQNDTQATLEQSRSTGRRRGAQIMTLPELPS